MEREPWSNQRVWERAYLLALDDQASQGDFTADESLLELAELATTAGLTVIGSDVQKLEHPVAGSYFGKGKITTWGQRFKQQQANVVVVDTELKPAQQRDRKSTRLNSSH